MVIGTMVDRSMRAASRLMVALHTVLSQYCLHVVSELVFIVWALSWPSVRVVSQLVSTLMPVCGLRCVLSHSWSSVCGLTVGLQCVVSQLVFSGCGLTVGLHSDASVWSHSWSSVCVVSQLVFSVCGLSWSSVCVVSQLVFSVCVVSQLVFTVVPICGLHGFVVTCL